MLGAATGVGAAGSGEATGKEPTEVTQNPPFATIDTLDTKDPALVSELIVRSQVETNMSVGVRCEDTDAELPGAWWQGHKAPPPFVPVARFTADGGCVIGGWIPRAEVFPQYGPPEERSILGHSPRSEHVIYGEDGQPVGRGVEGLVEYFD